MFENIVGKEELDLAQKGVMAAFDYVLKNDPRFNKNPNALRLKQLMQSEEVMPVLKDFIFASTKGLSDEDKAKEKRELDAKELAERTLKLGAMAYGGSLLGPALGGSETFADKIVHMATHLDNPTTRKEAINLMIAKTKEFVTDFKAGKTPFGLAKAAETEALLVKGMKEAAKSGIHLAEHPSTLNALAKLSLNVGKFSAHYGKYLAVGGVPGMVASFGTTAVGAGLMFASSYAMTGNFEQSAHDAVGAAVPIDAFTALAKGDLNTGAAKLVGHFRPGTESLAQYALGKINPDNGPGIFLNAASRIGGAAVKGVVHVGESLLHLAPDGA